MQLVVILQRKCIYIILEIKKNAPSQSNDDSFVMTTFLPNQTGGELCLLNKLSQSEDLQFGTFVIFFVCALSSLLESSCGLLLPIGHVCHYMKRRVHFRRSVEANFCCLRVGSFNCLH